MSAATLGAEGTDDGVDIEVVRTSEESADHKGDGGYKVVDGVIQIVAGSGASDDDVELIKAIARVREDPRFRD